MFSGGPMNNPGVDIRAAKRYPDVKAGVNVRGTLPHPRISFFSEPPLPQSQILSLILAGGSLETAQSKSNRTQTGNELLAQGSAILAQQLGARVGIEDVSVESDLDNQTSLVLGKYLSPRLYVSYGISFTEQLNTLKLRYTLSDRWTIKTEVGKARGADLVYTIEKCETREPSCVTAEPSWCRLSSARRSGAAGVPARPAQPEVPGAGLCRACGGRPARRPATSRPRHLYPADRAGPSAHTPPARPPRPSTLRI